jgi:thiosulfate dehydrogenase [quinone] large subunit
MTTMIDNKVMAEVEETLRRTPGKTVVEAPYVTPEEEKSGILDYVMAALRIGMGWTFLWAFLDKTFGLGFATEAGKGWVDGGSPTYGFLTFGTKEPFAEFFAGMAGSVTVEWMFMLGLLGIGLPLMLGIGVRIAAATGIAMLGLMYVASAIFPENNPFLDAHIINALILLGIAIGLPGYRLGLGRYFGKSRLARRYPLLK